MEVAAALGLYRFDFRAFVDFAFREVYPGQTLVAGPHIDIVTDALMQCGRQEIRRLMINVPPRSLKSFCATIAWPIFMTARFPSLRIVVIAGTHELASDFTLLRQRLMASPRFKQVFPHLRYTVRGDTLEFSSGGAIVQTVLGRSQIGRGADIIVIDDPLSPSAANDDKRRSFVNAWYGADIKPRLNNKKARIVLVMQRLHKDDLCGHLLEGPEPWTRISLSAIARTDETWPLSNGLVYSRPKGAALCPEREDVDALHKTMKSIGGLNFAAQYLQAPRRGGTNRIEFREQMIYDGWTPDMPLYGKGGFYKIPVESDIYEEYFRLTPPAVPKGLRKMPVEQFNKSMAEEQARLVEYAKHRH